MKSTKYRELFAYHRENLRRTQMGWEVVTGIPYYDILCKFFKQQDRCVYTEVKKKSLASHIIKRKKASEKVI